MKKKINPLWGGRFKKNSSSLLKKINNSISFDYRLANQDIMVSIAYIKVLEKANVIDKKEYIKIKKALKEIDNEIQNNDFKFNEDFEDIHMNIEMALKEKVGEIAGKIHTGKSRNDQVTTDLKIWIREHSLLLKDNLTKLQNVILDQANNNIYTIMPGFTHLQNAQPISLGHYFLAFFDMFDRDINRLDCFLERLDDCPLGSGALAGTNFSRIDRKLLSKLLGFKRPSTNSLDSVSDRDYAIESLSIISILSMHFSRMAEDFIIWSSTGFSFIEFSDSFCTGSSIMPQKKNPDAAELIRSKIGRIYGSLFNLLTVLKGLPMTYSKDLQEDKEAIFDTFDSIEIIVLVMSEMIKDMKINKGEMLKYASLGYSTATDLADWMVENLEISFRKSHHITGKIVLKAEEQNCKLSELDLSDMQAIEPGINQEVFSVLSVKNSVKNKQSIGGTSFLRIKAEIKKAKKRLSSYEI